METILSLLVDLQRSHMRLPSKSRSVTHNHLSKDVLGFSAQCNEQSFKVLKGRAHELSDAT